MSKVKLGEWMWRFLAMAMLFAVCWTLWIIYQLSPPPLITAAAFDAAAKAMQRRVGNPSTQGIIKPTPGAVEPAQSATASASPGVEDPAKVAATAASSSAEAPAKVAAAAPVELPKPVPEKPAEKPVAAKAPDVEVVEAVEAWAKAWSSKDVDAYLAAYAKDFKTPAGEPRAEWEKNRRQRISAPKSITVKIDSLKVTIAREDRASVTFRQDYRSDVIDPIVTTKMLLMAKSDGRWLIYQEKSGN